MCVSMSTGQTRCREGVVMKPSSKFEPDVIQMWVAKFM